MRPTTNRLLITKKSPVKERSERHTTASPWLGQC